MWTATLFENTIALAIISQVWCAATSSKKQVAVDIGRNLTLPCSGESGTVTWIRDGREPTDRSSVLEDGSLAIWDVEASDSGIYNCIREGNEDVPPPVKVIVRTPPPPLVNVTVHPSTVLALVLWNVAGSGGHPIIDFTAEYKLHSFANGSGAPPEETWKIISPTHISPNSRQIDVYHLIPNTTYAFRVWATNALGPGDKVEVLGATLYIDGEAELAKHLLSGAETFDTRIWVAAVAVVMGTLTVLTFGTCLLLYRECRAPSEDDVGLQETMELVPNITLNPGYCEMRSEANATDCRNTINSNTNGTNDAMNNKGKTVNQKRLAGMANGYIPVNTTEREDYDEDDEEEDYDITCGIFSNNLPRKV